MSQIWLLLSWASFFEAAGVVVKISSSLKSTTIRKFSKSKSVKCFIDLDIWSDPSIKISLNRLQRSKVNYPYTHLHQITPAYVNNLLRSVTFSFCRWHRSGQPMVGTERSSALLREVLNPFTYYKKWGERETWEQSEAVVLNIGSMAAHQRLM